VWCTSSFTYSLTEGYFIVIDFMLASDLRADSQISFKLEKVLQVTLVQGVMLFPCLTVTCKIFSHIAHSGTE